MLYFKLKMSQSDSSGNLETSSIKNRGRCPLPRNFYSNSTLIEDTDEEDSHTETISSSTNTDDSQYLTIQEIHSLHSIETIDNFSPQTLKDWLKLAKILISRSENSENKHVIAKKSDELQDFFYFLAIEYSSMDDFVVEFLEEKRREFIDNWENIVDGCSQIFDLLIDVIDDIDLESSFSTT